MTIPAFRRFLSRPLQSVVLAATALLPASLADQIGFRGSPNAEGVVGWNRTSAGGPEAQRTGHELTWLRGLFGVNVYSDYHLAWPGFGNLTAGSTTALRPTGDPAGFPALSRWLAQRPAGTVQRLSIRLDRMDLGNDRQGTDWTYDSTNRVELRRYRRGSLSLLWGAEVIATAANVPLDLTVQYNTLANLQDDTASAIVSSFRFARTGGNLSADGGAVLDAFLQDCANSPLRLTVGRIVRGASFSRGGRTGFRYDLSNVVLETLAPDLLVDVVGSSAQEGAPATWTLRLSRASAFPVSVLAQTVNGTARVVSDFRALRQVVQFAPGQTVANLSTPTVDDALDETDETVLLNLSQAVNATIRSNDIPTRILDNDGPQVRIDNTTVVEGGSWPARTQGNTPVLSRVWLSAPSPQDIRVTVGTLNGTAVAPLNWGSQDFIPATNVVVIPAGQIQAFATNQVFGDWEDELDEHFTVALSNPVNATLGGVATANVTIADDDGPMMYLRTVDAWEGVGPEPLRSTNLTFGIYLMSPSVQDVEFTFEFAGGSATLGADHGRPDVGNALPQQPGRPTRYRMSIPAGQTQLNVSVPVFDDALPEGDETLHGLVSEVRNAFLVDDSAAVPGPNPNLPVVAAHRVFATIFDLDGVAVEARNRRTDDATRSTGLGLRAAAGGGFELTLPGGKSDVRIETSADLRNWSPWTPPDPAQPLHVDFGDGSPALFFRVVRE